MSTDREQQPIVLAKRGKKEKEMLPKYNKEHSLFKAERESESKVESDGRIFNVH